MWYINVRCFFPFPFFNEVSEERLFEIKGKRKLLLSYFLFCYDSS